MGWLFYFIFKIAYLVNFINTEFYGHIIFWAPGTIWLLKPWWVTHSEGFRPTCKDVDCQGTDGFPRTGASQKLHLLPQDLGLRHPLHPRWWLFLSTFASSEGRSISQLHTQLPAICASSWWGANLCSLAEFRYADIHARHTHRDTHVHIHAHIDTHSHRQTQACTRRDTHAYRHTHTHGSHQQNLGSSYKFILASPFSNWLWGISYV